MNRNFVYPGALPQDTDILSPQRNAMIALGFLAQATVGAGTYFDGLACTQTTVASLSVLVGPGSAFAVSTVDATAFGSLAADTNPLVKMGINEASTTLGPMTAPATAGQSVVYLVQAEFTEADGNSAVLSYYNSANPSVPYVGPGNTGASQNTTRNQTVTLSLVQGTAATTGSQTTPAPTTGNTGLYAITIANGQTTITSANIAVLASAPFIPAKLGNLSSLFAPMASATGYNRGIKIQVTSSTAISVAASTLAASNAAGSVLPISALSATIATGTTGLGGLDTGTIAASTVYYVYAVSNGTTSGAVISTSSANPASAITTTYPYYLRIGSVRTNASSLLLGTLQVGKTVRYVIGGPNVSSMPQMASAGTSGGALTAISVASYVPPNASKIGLLLAFSGTGSPSAVYAAAAPNGNYSTPSGYNSTPMWLGCTAIPSAGAISSDMLLESSSVYYASNYGTTGLFCLGWEESI